jgi:putative ABC transport system ATP-binding protein
MAVLDTQGLAVIRGGRSIVLPDLTLAAGETCLLTGPSGSGKSSLIGAIAGLLAPSSGAVRIEGQDLWAQARPARDRLRARRIGVVFQTLHLVLVVSVLDNLLLAARLAGLAPDQPRALAMLERLGVGDLARRKPVAMSHGQRQRVAIARAVMNRPALVLADEPTSALDDAAAGAVAAMLADVVAESGAALLIATHDARLAGLLPGRRIALS